MSSKHLIQLCVAVVLVLGSAGSALAQQAPWLDPAWGYRSQVSVSNPAGTPLSDFQVRILLDGSFDFTKVKADGSDLRFTDSTGTFVLPMWIESWNPASSMASLWVRVPSIPAAGTTLYLYYGNPVAASVANGSSTFDFFDDFEGQSQMVPGYFELSAPQTTLTLSQGWEGITPPHSLSVLEVNSDGFAYWGWYGTTSCTGIGLARSNDLVSWTKYPGNPLKTNARWPTVQKLGNTYYMLYTADFCTNASYIKLAASTDGINFTDVKTIVQPVPGQRNQNADLFFNPSDNLFYLYWYSGNDASVWNIKVRSASSPAGLDSTASEQTVLTSNQVLAAPHMMLYGGSYYLATEIISNNDWATIVYASTSPVLGFKLLPGNPLLIGGSACMFQHPFGTTLHNFYCKVTNNIWTVEHRTADLTAALPLFPVATSSNWAGSQGTWAIVTGTQQDGTTGKILQGTTSGGHQIMYSAFSGSDYVLEACGRQVQGRTWGLATRVRDTSDFYSTNLYADLDASQNLWEYGWINSSGQAQTLGSAAVGAVDLNAWYKLSVKVHGSTIEVFKDGASQLITSAASLASGGVGLYGENGTIAQFNNVLVHKYAVADPTSVVGPATSPSSQAAVAAVSLNPATVAGGNPSTGTVTLNAAAPAGGASVSLSSSNSAAATVPASVTVPAGATWAEFVVSSLAVSTDTASTVTAAYNGTAAATITVTAPGVSVGVASVTLTPTSVVGGSLSTGTVTLSGPAPTGGVAVALSSSNTSVATVPANVTVNAGSSSATFKVASLPVAAAGTATITASFSGSSAANITVNPPMASSLTLNPASVVGGNASTGTVTLTGPAPAGGSLMSLTSSNTAVASVPANVTVVAGATSANFSITTFAVSSSTSLTITASFGGAQTAALTVTPPPAIAFVQGVSSDHSNSPSTSSAGTFTAANRAGDLIVVGVAVLGSVSSVTDSLGNSYSLAASSTSPAGVTTAVYFAPNIKAGANTLTVRFAASSYNNVDMFEYSGLSPASPVDKTSVASGTSASASSGPVTTSFANELIFAFAQDDGSTFGGGGTGFTVRSHVADNCAEDRVVSIAGSFSASCTWSGTTGWAMVLVTLR